MAKIQWKPGNMIYPLPAVMVSCADKDGNSNIITVAWTGTVCTNPPMAYISVRPERHSYQMIRETGEFVINLTTKDLAFATDFCGVRSGRDVDKFAEMKLTKEMASVVSAPMIGECPVNIECKVTEVKQLGSHHMFLADVVAVPVDDTYMNENQKFDIPSFIEVIGDVTGNRDYSNSSLVSKFYDKRRYPKPIRKNKYQSTKTNYR